MGEFKNIQGYEGLYYINASGIVQRGDGKIMAVRQRKDEVKNGKRHLPYRSVSLSREGNQKEFSVHILVAIAFIGPKPGPDFCVLHLNDDPTDNRVENLRWGTFKENSKQCFDRNRANRNIPLLRKVGANNKSNKPVSMLKNGKILFQFSGVRDADRWTGISSTCISAVCKGKRPAACGYGWQYI